MKRYSREAETAPVDLPVRGSKLNVSAMLCLVLTSCAPEEASPVTWDFSFQCELDADQTELVELQVAKGGCPITEPVAFETVTSTWDSPASRPQGLPAGIYSFQGTAWDANGKPVASHCQSVQLPVKEPIALNLQGTAACDRYEPELLDDAGPRDSGTSRDAGSPMDDGSVPDGCPDDDAKTSAGQCGCGMPDLDEDGDGTADCNDGCPDDGAKAAPGQCGCGMPDLDEDGDGTADCNDKCPDNPNKTEPGMCGCSPKTMLLSNETLTVGQYLCGPRDDSVRFAMEDDGHLHLRIDGVQAWVSDREPGFIARMQGDGNLVIRPMSTEAIPNPPSVWSSGTVYKVNDVVVHNVSFLAVHANGTVTISSEDKVVWTRP